MISALVGILKAVFLAVWNAVCLALKLVYKILRFLRIRILTLYVLVCAILSVFLPVFGEGIVYFWVGFALCCAITVGSWLYAASRKFAARPRRAGETVAQNTEPKAEQQAEPSAAPAPTPSPIPAPAPTPAPAERYPKYFDVEGAPQYFFAEYADRYELYMRDGDKAIYIRTDNKN